VESLREVERASGRHFKRGKFTRREREIITKTLDAFCQQKGLSREDFVRTFFTEKQRAAERYGDERFKELFIEVAKQLEGRPVLLVYQCMRRMFHPGNQRGRWLPEDDQELQRLFAIHGPDWETIGIHMGRYGMNVRDRYKLFRNKGASGPWTEEEIIRLREAVQEVRNLQSKNGDKPTPCWILVSERVGTRSVSQCMIKWSMLETIIKNQGSRPEWSRHLDYYLCNRLYDLGVEDETEIRWRDLADEGWPVHFSPRDLQVRWRTLSKRIRNYQFIALDDILEALLMCLRPLTPDTIADDDDGER
jgi:hypothetical protein